MERDARPDHGLEMEIRLRTGIPFAAIESRYHDVDILPEPDGYRVVLREPDAMPDRDFELTWFPDLRLQRAEQLPCTCPARGGVL